MKKKFVIVTLLSLILLSGCQTIKNKYYEVAEKENEKYELKMELGAPTEDFVNELGNETLVYKTKKYGLPCDRKFEINSSGTIIGFNSSGCF